MIKKKEMINKSTQAMNLFSKDNSAGDKKQKLDDYTKKKIYNYFFVLIFVLRKRI